ncbi:MAG: hypothetical protein ACTSRK_14900 [Promethearchaeota archaeon]
MEKSYMTDEEKLEEYEKKIRKKNRYFKWSFVGIVLFSIIWFILYIVK